MDLSSPISNTPMEEFLTPRSKVAKMLADIDNAATPSPPTSKPVESKGAAISHPPGSRPGSAKAKRSPTSGPFQDESTDESEEEISRPLGRAARRMLGMRAGSPVEKGAGTPRGATKTSQLIENEDDEDPHSATPARSPHRDMVRRRVISSSPIGTARSSRSFNLFVSPAKSAQQDSDEEIPRSSLGGRNRLTELVAQKRAEREAREQELQSQREHASPEPSSDLPVEAIDGLGEAINADIERIMSGATRPTRKASKKALEEMERETQRLSRQQALAHQMKTKKKFTTHDLFAKFNYRRQEHEKPLEIAQEGTSSSVPNSDGAEPMGKEPVSTPPSSPPTPLDRQRAIADYGALSKLMPVRQDSIANLTHEAEEELPSVEEVFRSSQLKATPQPTEQAPQNPETIQTTLPTKDDSDDELEILPQLPKHLRVFDNIKAPTKTNHGNSSKAVHMLKHLSHIGAYVSVPGKKKGSRPSVNANALEIQLRTRAKAQARQLQQERIAELKAKGIEIQSFEEREKEAEIFENLLEKARKDAVELRYAEKAARRAEKGDEGNMQASEDESEDDDYVGSGSEEEDGAAGLDEHEEDELLDDAAEETEGEEEDEPSQGADTAASDDEEDFENKTVTPSISAPPRKSRKSHIIQDNEDDEMDVIEETAPVAVDEADPFAAFGFGGNAAETSLLSPTQAFNATMQTPTQATQEDSFDVLRNIAPPSVSSLAPVFVSNDGEMEVEGDTQVSMVPASQVPERERINLEWETQPPQTPVLKTATPGLSETPGWEPTQDPGLPSPWTIGLRRESTFDSIADHETQSTVQLRVSESPMPSAARRRGRLVRRRAAAEDSDADEETTPQTSASASKEDVFNLMARKRKDALSHAERQAAEKEAKAMMDEQAEESEDEYTGLGGDDYIAPETEQDKEMIDTSHIDVDERELAAHFAERQRLADEAETSKLYKDLTTGALRRKQANAFDLDEDEDEIALRRRQARQREEARRRKLLLQDDNIAGLAEGRASKAKEAFLKAIADDDDDDDADDERLDFLEGEFNDATQATQEDSQTEAKTQSLPVLREISGNKRRSSEDEDSSNEMPPVKQRRTEASAFRKPASLVEVRESLSFLLDEPHAMPSNITSVELNAECKDEDFLSDSDAVDEFEAEKARQNDGGYAPNPATFDAAMMPPPPRLPASQRRTASMPTVVDRLSLKRGSSTSSSESGRGPTAWAASASGGFKVPSLLRRAATTLASNANDRGVTTLSRENSASSTSSGGGVTKRGGSNKSSLAYQARAEERRAIVEASAVRRQENTLRIAQLRRSTTAGGLGRGLKGKFE
ncbi:Hypothetical protein R9X50_00430900 [Acrodontium crateriforme]|uniref:DNA replication checkpoint mediator MRC1 domain-containing protein n=1 Tax=Acrodontium crateriforme TaxID=150365 RepID=A0AAQ3M7D2_9PEZI|nr:Hypothetical protein R9X50_00430900 [Acrodontium crateriforme]